MLRMGFCLPVVYGLCFDVHDFSQVDKAEDYQ